MFVKVFRYKTLTGNYNFLSFHSILPADAVVVAVVAVVTVVVAVVTVVGVAAVVAFPVELLEAVVAASALPPVRPKSRVSS